ncbi:MAG: ABC transporter permease, partial [Candidatus Bathyarchaeia archaeon]
KGLLTAVYVKVSEDASVNAVAQSISEKIGQVKVIKTNELASTVSQRLQNLLSAFLFLGGLIIGTTVILISSVSSLTVNEKRRNIGVLRAIGASKLFVSKLLASHILLLSLFGGAAGIGSAALAFYLNFQTITRSLQIPFVPLPFLEFVGIIFVSLLVAVASGVAASVYPAYKANKIDPYDGISRDPP